MHRSHRSTCLVAAAVTFLGAARLSSTPAAGPPACSDEQLESAMDFADAWCQKTGWSYGQLKDCHQNANGGFTFSWTCEE